MKTIFRADRGFCRWRRLRWCDGHGEGYIVGLAKNKRINAMASGLIGFAEDTKEGKTGTSVGVIVQIEDAKYFIESEDGRHEYMAYWREGGLDQKMVKRLKKFKIGDKVKVDWTMQERRRFDQIKKVEGK